VGGGEQLSDFVSRIRDYKLRDRIHLAGPKDNVLPYLAAMDIGVLSSLAEGFSNSLLEYMAAGLPAIATDVGGNREALGDSGILIPPDDPQALANAILELCSPELRDRLGKAARARVERFGLERAEARLGEIYEEFVRSRSVGPGGLVVREDLPMDENRPQWPGK
jgi:glycosyltransferase involved in cell wall biosynthesis